MINIRRAALAALCTCLGFGLAFTAPFALAQSAAEYPSKPLLLVVPYPPGGTADQFGRAFAQALGQLLKQTVVVENRAGANGNIGSTYVAKTLPADGYTVLLGSTSTLAINPHIYRSMGYDPLKDLQPVSLTHQMPNVLMVNGATPYKNVADVIAAAKAKPGDLSYGSAGNGNTMHLAGELFQRSSGTHLQHVPYKGGPPALSDLIGGHIPMMFNNLPAALPFMRSDKLRVLAVADSKRSPLMPDVPTLAEAGVANAESVVWNGMLVRNGTPAPIVAKLNEAMRAVLQSPEFRKPLEAQGFEVLSSTPKTFEDLLRKDSAAMGTLVKSAGIHAD